MAEHERITPEELAEWKRQAEQRLASRDRMKCPVCGATRNPETGVLTHQVIEAMTTDCSLVALVPLDLLRLIAEVEARGRGRWIAERALELLFNCGDHVAQWGALRDSVPRDKRASSLANFCYALAEAEWEEGQDG